MTLQNYFDFLKRLQMLPFDEQQWSAYMGSHGDSHWLPRKHPSNERDNS